jgi:hypothetical protein
MPFTRYVAIDVSNSNAYFVIDTEEDSSPHSHHCDNMKLHKILSVSLLVMCKNAPAYPHTSTPLRYKHGLQHISH